MISEDVSTFSKAPKTLLEQLQEATLIVADTGDIHAIKQHKPQDATTNPSLILKAAGHEEYQDLLREARAYAKKAITPNAQKQAYLNRLAVNFGKEILKIIPGRVSTEVDARLSFDVDGTVACAEDLIALYEKEGVTRERILIKIASTWEGLMAANMLREKGIRSNMTLVFCMIQGWCAGAFGLQLISPFVGRIYDWYRVHPSLNNDSSGTDPGVHFVTEIYNMCKKFDHATEIMGASFRNIDQIASLRGCDLLTVSPKLLDELSQKPAMAVPPLLSHEKARLSDLQALPSDEKTFRWMMNQDAMATEKLAEGIRLFAQDTLQLESTLTSKTPLHVPS